MTGSPPEPLPDDLETAFQAIQRHRTAIVEAQHKVLKRQLTMPEYNAVYKQHLDAIHALEKRIWELQQAQGHGPPGGGGHY